MTPEARLRSHCRRYLTAALPAPGYFSAIEHARRFDGDPEARMRQASWWKGQGVKAGLADIMIWYRLLFLGVELKVGSNKATEAEKAFGAAMRANGQHWEVCYSVVELDAMLRRLGMPIPRSMQIEAQSHDATLAQPEAPKKAKRARNWDWSGEARAAESAARLQGFLDEE